MLEITIYRSRCTGAAHGWRTINLTETTASIDLRASGCEISLHIHSAHEARRLAYGLIEASDAIEEQEADGSVRASAEVVE